MCLDLIEGEKMKSLRLRILYLQTLEIYFRQVFANESTTVLQDVQIQ